MTFFIFKYILNKILLIEVILHFVDNNIKTAYCTFRMTRSNTIKHIFINYCESSNTVGLYLVAKKNARILSLLILISVTGYCCYQCKLNINDYLSYDISTRVTLTNNSDRFPAITFCPQSVFKRSTFSLNYYRAVDLALFYFTGKKAELNSLTNEVRTDRYCK